MSDEEKTAHLLQMIEFANTASDTEQPLQSIISEIRQHYFVNTFQFCPVGTDINYPEVTDREIIDPRAPIKLYDTYKSWVNEAGCFSLGDYENAKGFLPELSAFMENNRIYSILVVPFIDDKDNFKGIFTLGSDIQYIWSWADILNLRIICNVISKFL